MADAPQLFLIDGNSLAYRAFFALPESIGTSDGRPTNAIYGLASMLVKIIDEHHPQGVVVAWDAGWSGREKTYDLYKAQRKPRPDLLREQWPHLMPLVEAFGYTNVRVDGYEADDVIASLVKQAREQGIEVMVVTGDRDAYQLVSEGVRVMSTSRGITETKIYDRAAVEERYGVPPELICDLMGLRGDTSDNIPGVPGIGEKTATQLLQQFGSLEAVLESVDRISGKKRKENLTQHADDARLSKQLATLQYDIETGVDLGEAMSSEPDRGALREFMREFELRAVMERLEEALPEGDAVPGRKVETELAVEAVAGKPEDLGEGPVALAIGGDRWAAAEGDRVLAGSNSHDELAVALGTKPFAAHDAKSLGGGRHGLLAAAAREGVEPNLDHDTMIAAYLLEPQRRTYDLVELSADAGIGLAEGAAAEKGEDDGQLALGEDLEPGLEPAEEAQLVAALAAVQRPRIEELGLGQLLREVELPLVGVLAAMEREGLKLDAERLAEVGAGFGERIDTLEREIYRPGRRGVHDRLAAAGRPHPLREARPDEETPRQDRVLDRRPRPRPDPRRAPDRREDRAVAGAEQAEEHLPRHPAGADRPRDRPRPHHLQPGLDHHRPPLQHQPEPAEHPDPDRDRPAGPRLLRRRRGIAAALRRLQPGRAPRPRPRG